MAAKTPRTSNLELLRILCMLFIIGDHLTGQGGHCGLQYAGVVVCVLPDRLRFPHCLQCFCADRQLVFV